MRLLLLLLFAVPAFAHPPVSVAIDSRGNVFYSDLKHVWRVAPDGRESVAVRDVHTHELALDAHDNLYGEHLWYEGERIDKWGHYVWRRAADGTVTKVIPPREGFLTNYSFVRDARGTMYWADREANVIRKRTVDGRISVHARGSFRDVRWMTVTHDGIVFFIDHGDLVRVAPDGRMTRTFIGPRRRHALMGLWTDIAGNVYIADTANRAVKRVTAQGAVTTFAKSPAPWSPCGGAFARNGELWLLEVGPANAVRVRRVPSPAPRERDSAR